MKKITTVILVILYVNAFSQKENGVFLKLDEALKNPNSVIELRLTELNKDYQIK